MKPHGLASRNWREGNTTENKLYKRSALITVFVSDFSTPFWGVADMPAIRSPTTRLTG